jgi:CRISPR-associated exonuclease Cas4
VYAFSDLATAAYCPRQLYYRRGDDRSPPPAIADRRALAFRYPDLLDADDATLRDLPIERPPAAYRRTLRETRDRLSDRPLSGRDGGAAGGDGSGSRDLWGALVDPVARETCLLGRRCRGVVHKLIESGVPAPVHVSPGDPPDRGVWEPQSVRSIAAAKALSYAIETPVDHAVVEYPAHGVVRTVRITTRRRAAYRRAAEAVASLDADPPSRIDDRSKCAACDYSDRCGVRTRSLRSLLGLEPS